MSILIVTKTNKLVNYCYKIVYKIKNRIPKLIQTSVFQNYFKCYAVGGSGFPFLSVKWIPEITDLPSGDMA